MVRNKEISPRQRVLFGLNDIFGSTAIFAYCHLLADLQDLSRQSHHSRKEKASVGHLKRKQKILPSPNSVQSQECVTRSAFLGVVYVFHYLSLQLLKSFSLPLYDSTHTHSLTWTCVDAFLYFEECLVCLGEELM